MLVRSLQCFQALRSSIIGDMAKGLATVNADEVICVYGRGGQLTQGT